MQKEIDKLVHRLNRVSGQINSLKKQVEAGPEGDCLQTLQQLKASINALKKFGEAYMKSHMSQCLRTNSKSQKEMEETMADVISGAFSL